MEACMWRSFYFVFYLWGRKNCKKRIVNVRTVKAGRIAKERIVKAGNINERTTSAYPQKMKDVGMEEEKTSAYPQKMKSVGMGKEN